jgi:hypothetical protein
MRSGVKFKDIVTGTGDEATRVKTVAVNLRLFLNHGTELTATVMGGPRRVIDLCRLNTLSPLPGWMPECPERASQTSPGQAKVRPDRVSPWVGRSQETSKPCMGETGSLRRMTLRPSSGLFRPVGASDVSFGCYTQGSAPRRLGACPGLVWVAPLGLRAPDKSRKLMPSGCGGFNRAPLARRSCALRSVA